MTITMNIWIVLIVLIIVWLFGFFIGRTKWNQNITRDEKEKRSERDLFKHNGAMILASPVLGQLCYESFDEKSGVCIKPENGMVYAPTSGKIIKLFPNGNEFILRTDIGPEIRIKVGSGDELDENYFRPRIIQNEIISKGKLILEFDKEALEMEGNSANIIMKIENDSNKVLFIEGEKHVKNGQDCIGISD